MRNRMAALTAILVIAILGCKPRAEAPKPLALNSAAPAKLQSGQTALIELHGAGFTAGAKVSFSGQDSPQVVFSGPELLVALTPAGLKPGKTDIKVQNPDGKSAALTAALTIETRVSIKMVSPAAVREGDVAAKVRIRGEGFAAGAKVSFGELASPAVTVIGPDFIEAGLPALKPGMKAVTVENSDGGKAVAEDALQVMSKDEELPVLAWTEAAADAGVIGVTIANENDSAVAVADLNQDGRLDLVVPYYHGCSVYLGAPDGRFTTAEDTGLKARGVFYGAFLGDFDNDGLPDIFFSGQPSQLFHNLGGGKFEDVTERVGLPKALMGWGACWGDYDGDGRLDLYVGSPKGDDSLFHNLGGRFEPVFKDLMAKGEFDSKVATVHPTTFSAAFGDYDNDGYPDLFVGVRGLPSRLFHNLKGKGFKDVLDEVGIKTEVPLGSDKKLYKMNWGVTWGDYNNDGWLDLFATSADVANDLYRNDHGKGFTEVFNKTGIHFGESPLAPAWGDVDNDGWLDLVMSDNLAGLRVYKNRGDGTFADISEPLGLLNKPSNYTFGIAFADFNRDGALDLYVTDYMKENQYYLGATYPGRHYLEVELKGTTSNSMAIDAMAVVQAGATVMVRMVSGGDSYLSQSSPILHFGLGPSTTVDKLTIRWPGGAEQTLEKIPADQVLTVTQPGERKPLELPPPPPPAPTAGATVEKGSTAPGPKPAPAPAPPAPTPAPSPAPTPAPAPEK